MTKHRLEVNIILGCLLAWSIWFTLKPVEQMTPEEIFNRYYEPYEPQPYRGGSLPEIDTNLKINHYEIQNDN
jgi:hypothetical protein